MNLRTAVELINGFARRHPEHLDSELHIEHTDLAGVDTIILELTRRYEADITTGVAYALNETSRP